MKIGLYLSFLFSFLSFSGVAQINGTLSYGGQNRTYILHVPSSYTGQQPAPLLFVLHGFTQTASAMQSGSGFDAISEATGWIVVYANGVNNAWNTNSGFPGGSTADDVGFLVTLADTLSTQYTIDAQRIYSCGFSAGGFMSHLLACSRADRFAAIAAVSGTMSAAAKADCQPSRPVPVMQIHGTSDNVVSYAGGFGGIGVDELMTYWRGVNGCGGTPVVTAIPDTSSDNSTVSRESALGCDGCSEVELLKVNSGGHTWPGTTAAVFGLGTINRDIRAEVEIWNFLQRFALGGCNSISETAEGDVDVYPNPTSRELHLGISDGLLTEVVIYNLRGETLLSVYPNQSDVMLSVDTLPAGSYVGKLRSGASVRLFSFIRQ